MQSGQTGLSIAQRLGYISVVEILRHVTEVEVAPADLEEKYKVIAPETMIEAPMTDSEEETGREILFNFIFTIPFEIPNLATYTTLLVGILLKSWSAYCILRKFQGSQCCKLEPWIKMQ
jgi:hypothetical protein